MCPSDDAVFKPAPRPPGFKAADHLVLWFSLIAWVAFFIVGALVNSEPFRSNLTALELPIFPDRLYDFLIVAASYTLTNVAILCILAAVLGTLGRRSQLGTDDVAQNSRATINPLSSAVLRGFVVYLALISGVLVFGENPAEPTQTQYVRLAGFASLVSFALNWNPSMFARFLQRVGSTIQDPPSTRTRDG